MTGMFKEFREFVARGNVFELAVGIIIGAAFTAIVNSIVEDLINPFVGLFTGGIDFNNLFVPLTGEDYASVEAAEAAGAAVIRYGSFVTAVINFLIIALVVFLMVRAVNRIRGETDTAEQAEEAPPAPTQEALLAEIRDLLREGRVASSPSGPGPTA